MQSHESRRSLPWLIFDVSQINPVRNPHILFLAVVASVCGCASKPTSSADDRRVIRSSQFATVTHVGANVYSSAIYAVTNHNLEVALRGEFGDAIECFIVPHSGGYKIVTLSNRELREKEKWRVSEILRESLRDAERGAPMYSERKKG